MTGLQVLALGRGLPRRSVTNDELSQLVETSDEWIASRTGIRARRFAGEGETNLTLATQAAQEAIARAGVRPADIAVCLVATFTPDTLTPSMACGVAGALGLSDDALCFDLNAACSGFLYALPTAQGLLAQTPDKCALVIGSEVISRVMDMTDRNTCVLFGDGAGAAVVRLSDAHPFAFTAGCKPDDTVLRCSARDRRLEMDGHAVFRFAVETVPQCINALLAKTELGLDDVQQVVCHQANRRIIESAVRRLHAQPQQFFMNLDQFGNTSAASIPLALYDAAPAPGSRVVCVGFGAGLTYGAALLTF